MSFRSVKAWVFDLDNTLYPTGSLVYELIGARMTDYVGRIAGLDAEAAFELQERYFDQYGATLAGLIRHHGVNGRDFLDYVHDVDLSCVDPDPELAQLIAILPGKRIVFTNGGRSYAERMTARIGLDGLFDDLFDIEAAGFAPKPQPESFKALIARHSLTPTETLFFEDSARNLETAHALGFRTVFIGDWREGGSFPEHIHHAHACIKSFLRDHVVLRLNESPARAEA